MKLSDAEKKELLSLANNRKNRRAFRAARVLPLHHTYDDFIAFLDDIQKLRPAPMRYERPFVRYKFNPF